MVREPVNQLISNYYYMRSVQGFVDDMDEDDVKMVSKLLLKLKSAILCVLYCVLCCEALY